MSGLRKVGCPLSWVAEGRMETERIALSQRERDRLESVAGRGAGAFNAGGSGRTDTFV